MAARTHLAAALALGLTATGCKGTPTQLLVVVDSDLEVPATMTQVEVRAEVTGGPEVVSTFDVTGPPGSTCTPTACTLPLTVGVVPEAGDTTKSALIAVRALGPAGALVTRTVQTGFLEGRRLLVPVYLSSRCQAVQCDPGSTCDRGACVPETIDPATFDEVPESFEPSRVFPTPPRPDAATQVADAGVARDATLDDDASAPADSGAAMDASVLEDSGGLQDAEAVTDTGGGMDAVATTDGGGGMDAVAMMDTGGGMDAVAMMDTGGGMDASMPPIMLDWVQTVTSMTPLFFTRSEVTVDQYAACVRAGACDMSTFMTNTLNRFCNTGHTDRGDHPMNCVDWTGADSFCRWVGARLPTEAEWYAEASNNGGRRYPWGDSPSASCTHVVMRSATAGGNGCGRDRSWTVCRKRAGDSVSGLCDMSGNVWEFTQDGTPTSRVILGGSYSDDGQLDFRSTSRNTNNNMGLASLGTGFRCVR